MKKYKLFVVAGVTSEFTPEGEDVLYERMERAEKTAAEVIAFLKRQVADLQITEEYIEQLLESGHNTLFLNTETHEVQIGRMREENFVEFIVHPPAGSLQ